MFGLGLGFWGLETVKGGMPEFDLLFGLILFIILSIGAVAIIESR